MPLVLHPMMMNMRPQPHKTRLFKRQSIMAMVLVVLEVCVSGLLSQCILICCQVRLNVVDVGPLLHQSRELVQQFFQRAAVNLFEGGLGLRPRPIRGHPDVRLRTRTLSDSWIPIYLETLTSFLLH